MYNQRLFRSFFALRNSKAALKHFRKLRRRNPATSGFAKLLTGRGNRLDVILVLINIAPTLFWARTIAQRGILRVNGAVIRDPGYRVPDCVYLNKDDAKINELLKYFKSPLARFDSPKAKYRSASLPKNFEYYSQIKTIWYKGLPKPEHIRTGSRIPSFLFRMFEQDSGSGH